MILTHFQKLFPAEHVPFEALRHLCTLRAAFQLSDAFP